jgi:hypothetical protein
VRGRLGAHLASRDVARVIYGAVIGLALVVALERHPPSPGAVAGLLAGTAMVVGLAELFSEVVGAETRTRRPVSRDEVRGMTGEALAVVLGAGFPAVFFVAAAAGAGDGHLAFTLAKWTGLGLICIYGYLAARLAGAGGGSALLHGAIVGVGGLVLIQLEAHLH